MKRAMGLALALWLILGMTASAQTKAWTSGIFIKNLDADHENTVTLVFYWAQGYGPTGRPVATLTKTLAPNRAGEMSYWSLYTDDVGELPDNFVGSAVAMAQYPIATNLNTQLPPQKTGATPDNPVRVGTSTGASAPSKMLYLTQVMKQAGNDRVGYFNSYIAVQNTSAAETANVEVRFYNHGDCAEVVAARETAAIPPFATHIFHQGLTDALPVGWQGSAVLTSDQPVVGGVNFFNDASDTKKAQFNSYDGFGVGARKIYVPRLALGAGDYQSGLTVMKAGPQDIGECAANVTITYYFNGETRTQVLPKLCCAASFYLAAQPEVQGLGGLGSAIITADGWDIVATVNEDNREGNIPEGHGGRSATYGAVLGGSETQTLVFSQVTARYQGYSTGVRVQNVGDAAATVAFTFSGASQDYTVEKTLLPGASDEVFAPSVVPEGDYNGSCVVVSDQPIVGVACTSLWWGDVDPTAEVKYGDSMLCYDGVNK